jgi:hypothetical protein
VNATERILLMAEIIKERPTAEWLQQLDTNDVPSAPVLRRNEVIANEQVVARELIVELDHPDIGPVRQPKPVARFDRTPAQIQGPAPRIGEHTAAILASRNGEIPYRRSALSRNPVAAPIGTRGDAETIHVEIKGLAFSAATISELGIYVPGRSVAVTKPAIQESATLVRPSQS